MRSLISLLGGAGQKQNSMAGFENVFSPSGVSSIPYSLLDLQLSEIGDECTGWDCIALDFLHDGVNITF
jgi:hypothetical protein